MQYSKPHPETYSKAAQELGIMPDKCLVFEDAPKGVEAAFNAGMPCIAITGLHEQQEFEHYSNIIRFIKDYTNLAPADLLS